MGVTKSWTQLTFTFIILFKFTKYFIFKQHSNFIQLLKLIGIHLLATVGLAVVHEICVVMRGLSPWHVDADGGGGLSCYSAHRILDPRLRTEPASPALPGRF